MVNTQLVNCRMKPPQQRHFRQPHRVRRSQSFPILFLAVTSLFGFGALYNTWLSQPGFQFSDVWIPLVVFGSVYGLLFYINVYPDILLSDEGLLVEVFFAFFVKIPWTNISSVQRKDTEWRVEVTRQTIFHWFIALGKHPYFLIDFEMAGAAELVEWILKKSGINETNGELSNN